MRNRRHRCFKSALIDPAVRDERVNPTAHRRAGQVVSQTGRVSLAIVLSSIVALSSLATGTARTGTVCIAPVTDAMIAADRGDPRGPSPRRDFHFNVQFDNGKRVDVPRVKGLPMSGLAIGKRHLVRIRDGEKLIESFFFTFKDRGSTNLCLSYGPWYETWDLSAPGRRRWCRCQ